MGFGGKEERQSTNTRKSVGLLHSRNTSDFSGSPCSEVTVLRFILLFIYPSVDSRSLRTGCGRGTERVPGVWSVSGGRRVVVDVGRGTGDV